MRFNVDSSTPAAVSCNRRAKAGFFVAPGEKAKRFNFIKPFQMAENLIGLIVKAASRIANPMAD